MISGIGIPLTLENESITLGLTIKAQYFLPENADQLKPIYFPGIFGKELINLSIFTEFCISCISAGNFTPVNFAETQSQEFPNGRRKREVLTDKYTGQKYEQYVGDVQELGSKALKSNNNENFEYNDEALDDAKIPMKENFVSTEKLTAVC